MASGATAQFTTEKTGEVTIEVAYTPPDAEDPCYNTHTVAVYGVSITGPTEAKVGEAIILTADGKPPAGFYAWSNTPGLVANGSTAEFTAEEPGEIIIEVAYTPPDAVKSCHDTHT